MPSSKSRPNANELLHLGPHSWEDRTSLAKREAEVGRLGVEAKTARLRALRLDKEAADKADGEPTALPDTAAKPPRRKGTLSIKV